MDIILFAAFLVILLSAICSGTEAALFSVPILKVRQMLDEDTCKPKFKRRTEALLKIREKMSRPISMIVIMNNIANISGTTVVTLLAHREFNSFWVGVISGALTLTVIVFAEITPKTVGERHSMRIALFMARPVLLFTKLFTPIIFLVELFTRPFTSKAPQTHSTDEREIRYMAQLGEEEGVIEADELEMLHGVFQLNDMDARALMTPRISLTCIEGDMSINAVIDEVIESQHSRIIVIGESRDDVLGVALKSSLLIAMVKGKGEDKVLLHGYDPVEVQHDMKADQILPIFQKSRQHLAIVRDEFGGVDGVITLEDIIEELTGEIVDETDTDEDMREAAAS
jgi:CBS domain containing-hemolysin-like protein